MSRSVQVTVTLPDKLAAKLDEMLEAARRDHPFISLSRSQLVQHLLSEHIDLLDDPGHQASLAPRKRRRRAR